MKIAWMSNAPWASTGYGQQTAQVLPRLRDAGHDVCVVANYGLQGSTMDWDGFRVYPTGRDYSNDVAVAHALHFFDGEPGLLLALYDAWTLQSPTYREVPMAVWTPVDHLPAPPLVVQHFKAHDSTPIAMSRYGERQLRAAGLDPLYVPHGIDTSVFCVRNKREARLRFGFDQDAFLVGMVSTNNSAQPCRKAYPEAFAAMAILQRERPDVHLYVHAEMRGAMGGIDLGLLATSRGLQPDRLVFADQYRYRNGLVSPTELSWLYNAFDVLLFPSMGEGFGIPAIEAQACGTPVIVSDFAAQAELAAPFLSYRVASQPYWDNAQAADFCVPLVHDLWSALDHAVESRAELAEARDDLCEFAAEYDADRVFLEHWLPALATLERELPSAEPIR